jgi:hypothetical protein
VRYFTKYCFRGNSLTACSAGDRGDIWSTRKNDGDDSSPCPENILTKSGEGRSTVISHIDMKNVRERRFKTSGMSAIITFFLQAIYTLIKHDSFVKPWL